MHFKKITYILMAIVLFSYCNDIDRDNILDPKNPASQRTQIVTIEAFVNTSDSLPYIYNHYLLDALDQLEQKYNEKIVIAEYHRMINGISDGYDSTANEILYGKYFDYFFNLNNNTVKGVPDVYLNGTSARVQGASSSSSVLFRIEKILDSLLIQNCHFTIEPKIDENQNSYSISTRIARLGSSDKENILVKVILLSRFDNDLHERVVVEYKKSQEITKISNGEIKEIDFDEITKPQLNSKLIFVITSIDELEIFQACEVDLN